MKTIFHDFLVFLIIFLPILLLLFYQRQYMGEVDTSVSNSHVIQLHNMTNQQFTNIQKEFSQKIMNIQKQQIKDQIKQWRNNHQQKCLERPLSQTKSIHIIAIMLSPGFIHQQDSIEKGLSSQLDWFQHTFNISLNHQIYSKQTQPWKLEKDSTLVYVRSFPWEYLEQNIANRLKSGEYKNELYLIDIAKHIKTLPMFSHCLFTNISCSQTNILLIKHQDSGEDYWIIDQNIYVADTIDATVFFNILVDILGLREGVEIIGQIGQQLVKQFHNLIRQQCYLRQTIVLLQYLSHIHKPSNFSINKLVQLFEQQPEEAVTYLKNGKYLSPYLHNLQEQNKLQLLLAAIKSTLKGQQSKVDFDPLRDTQVGQIDLFPNDFKIGVYLPLSVIFVYPLLLKIKEIIAKLLTIFKTKKVVQIQQLSEEHKQKTM